MHLFEKTDRLGGLLKHTDHVSFKWPLRDYKDYLIRKVKTQKNIVLHLETKVTPEELERQGFEAVLAAIGSEPLKLPIPGIDGGNVRYAVDVFGNEENVGETAVIIGGGEIGVETGIHLARKGHKVTVLEMTDTLAREAVRSHYYGMVRSAWQEEENFTGIVNATCVEILDNGVVYRDAEGMEHIVEADSVILSAGMRAKTEEAMQYTSAGQYFRMIGDCKKAQSVQQAIRNAYTTALAL